MPYVPIVHKNSPIYSAFAERHPRSADGSGLYAATRLSRHLRGVKADAGGMSRTVNSTGNGKTEVDPRRNQVSKVASKTFFVAYLLIVSLAATACSGVKGGSTVGSGGSSGSGLSLIHI